MDRLYTYSSRLQLETLSDQIDPASSVAYGYDATGNQISRTTRTGKTLFSFDVLNPLYLDNRPKGRPRLL